ncbi:MAG: hypothetical protein IH861_00470 [Chloroflexi bacterium]|nr:hypothetical protein [Chloroflexota bacterium]
MIVYIEDILWDDGNIAHIEERELLLGEVEEAILGQIRAFKKGGKLIIIGQSDAGRYLTVVLEHVDGEAWRPVTARECDKKEKRLARRTKTTRMV